VLATSEVIPSRAVRALEGEVGVMNTGLVGSGGLGTQVVFCT